MNEFAEQEAEAQPEPNQHSPSEKYKEAKTMEWSADGWHDAFRIELRVQAIGFASRGWPVTPGTYPAGDTWTGNTTASSHGPVPVSRDWQGQLGTNADQVAAWWSERPYSVLVATGPAIEAIEVGSELGRRAAGRLRTIGFPVPIVATPQGRWYFLTEGGQHLPDALAAEDIRLHGNGSWIPMPPSTYPEGIVHWRVKPEMCGWRLPTPGFVQDVLLDSLEQENDVAELLTAGR